MVKVDAGFFIDKAGQWVRWPINLTHMKNPGARTFLEGKILCNVYREILQEKKKEKKMRYVPFNYTKEHSIRE